MGQNEENARGESATPAPAAVPPEMIAVPRSRVLPPALLMLVFIAVAVLGFLVDPRFRIIWGLGLLFVVVVFALQAFTLLLLPRTMTLTQEGIVPASGGLIRWRDIAEIGTGEFPAKRPVPCIGLKLSDSAPYEQSLATRRTPFLKDWLRTARTAQTHNGPPKPVDGDVVYLLPRRRSVDWPLVPVGRRRPYDLAWAKQSLPGTPEETVTRICEYARRVARAQG